MTRRTIKKEVEVPELPQEPMPVRLDNLTEADYDRLREGVPIKGRVDDEAIKKKILQLLQSYPELWKGNGYPKANWKPFAKEVFYHTGKVYHEEVIKRTFMFARKQLMARLRLHIGIQKKGVAATNAAVRTWEFYPYFSYYRRSELTSWEIDYRMKGNGYESEGEDVLFDGIVENDTQDIIQQENNDPIQEHYDDYPSNELLTVKREQDHHPHRSNRPERHNTLQGMRDHPSYDDVNNQFEYYDRDHEVSYTDGIDEGTSNNNGLVQASGFLRNVKSEPNQTDIRNFMDSSAMNYSHSSSSSVLFTDQTFNTTEVIPRNEDTGLVTVKREKKTARGARKRFSNVELNDIHVIHPNKRVSLPVMPEVQNEVVPSPTTCRHCKIDYLFPDLYTTHQVAHCDDDDNTPFKCGICFHDCKTLKKFHEHLHFNSHKRR